MSNHPAGRARDHARFRDPQERDRPLPATPERSRRAGGGSVRQPTKAARGPALSSATRSPLDHCPKTAFSLAGARQERWRRTDPGSRDGITEERRTMSSGERLADEDHGPNAKHPDPPFDRRPGRYENGGRLGKRRRTPEDLGPLLPGITRPEKARAPARLRTRLGVEPGCALFLDVVMPGRMARRSSGVLPPLSRRPAFS